MSTVRDSLADTLRDCAQRIDDCRDAAAPQAKQTFTSAMTRVIAARNDLMRSEAGAAGQPTLRRLNALLSLMASIEFPLSGFHRERMAAVAQELRGIAQAHGPA